MIKKLKYMILLVLLLVPITGCGTSQTENQTVFKINEETTIDGIKIVLNDIQMSQSFQDVKQEKDTYLNLEFIITNTTNQTITIDSTKNFVFKIEEEVYTDLNHNKMIEIAPEETVVYTLIYDVEEQDFYEVLFYSGIVENNIKFTTL